MTDFHTYTVEISNDEHNALRDILDYAVRHGFSSNYLGNADDCLSDAEAFLKRSLASFHLSLSALELPEQ